MSTSDASSKTTGVQGRGFCFDCDIEEGTALRQKALGQTWFIALNGKQAKSVSESERMKAVSMDEVNAETAAYYDLQEQDSIQLRYTTAARLPRVLSNLKTPGPKETGNPSGTSQYPACLPAAI